MGLSPGGGLEYFFSPGFALDVGLKLTFGSFDEISFEGETENIDFSATGTRIDLGVRWYPAGKCNGLLWKGGAEDASPVLRRAVEVTPSTGRPGSPPPSGCVFHGLPTDCGEVSFIPARDLG